MNFDQLNQKLAQLSNDTLRAAAGRQSAPSTEKGPPYTIHSADNTEHYYYKDPERRVLHREDGPAVHFKNGYEAWYINSQLHRLDGPARTYSNGKKEWYLHGDYMSEQEHADAVKKLEIKNDVLSHKNTRIDPGMLEDYL